MRVIGATLCSGIGAPECAAPWITWAWHAEIEPFPAAVHAARFPNSVNLGDMTAPDLVERAARIALPDVIVAGTPCQAFSVAGLRGSLADARGNLTLTFIGICNAIDDLRRAAGRAPAWVVWENVPGVLSVADNAFGAFLGGLVGGDAALEPPRGRGWTDAGVVHGPERCAAWRVLDAQHFGLAQRRRRVFVVARGGLGSWAAADALLPVVESVRWHPAPRREAGQRVAPTVAGSSNGGGANGPGRDADSADSLIASTGRVAHCLNAGGMGRQDYETETLIAHTLRAQSNSAHDPTLETYVAHTLRASGFDAGEDGTGRGTPLVPVQPYTLAIRGRGDSYDLEFRQDGVANALLTPNGGRGGIGVGAVAHAFDARQSDVLQYGDRTGPLDTDGHSVAVAFSAKDHGADAGHLAPTLRAMGHGASHANGGGQVAVAFDWQQGGAQSNSLRLWEKAGTLEANRVQATLSNMQVRRLTPRECERLQGFPDDWTLIEYRGKPAADGPRYKALGNSMAVPVLRYLLERVRDAAP